MKFRALLLVALTGLFTACGGGEKKTETNSNTPSASPATETVVEEPVVAEVDPMENIGIGPIDELEFDEEIDMEIADAGKVIYEAKCTACHKVNKRYIGPSPQGIFERRNPAWVINMILNPTEMLESDPIAKALLAEYVSPMANQNLTIDEARSVVEYFRTLDPAAAE
ncbi:MAG: cytochrome c [Salibacteraceae bacterium]|jgi:mono/diheme cytochrome c family protein